MSEPEGGRDESVSGRGIHKSDTQWEKMCLLGIWKAPGLHDRVGRFLVLKLL